MKFDTNAQPVVSILDGECDFQVLEAQERTDKNGKPYMNVSLFCTDRAGNEARVFDNVFENKVPSFLKAIGKEDLIEKGEFETGDCYGNGRCVLERKPGARYTNVKEYVEPQGQRQKPVETTEDDGIPF